MRQILLNIGKFTKIRRQCKKELCTDITVTYMYVFSICVYLVIYSYSLADRLNFESHYEMVLYA